MDLLRFSTAGSVDDGKSTLIGRLLYDSKGVFEDQLEAAARSTVNRSAGPIDLSLLTDGLRAEREQGITIDVAYRYFATPKRKFIIADTPGHEQYTRNMATGASTADLAIILIDARYGALVQSRRHTIIASLLGIPNIVVAVNKMDLVGFSQARFAEIQADFQPFVDQLGFLGVQWIPLSALNGDNVVTRSDVSPWYTGPSLLEHLETVDVRLVDAALPLRFPVQYVIRPHLDFRGFAGQIAAGTVRVGDEVVSLPAGTRTRVKQIHTHDGALPEASAPHSISLVLEDEVDVSRGDMLVHAASLPWIKRDFDARLVWMDNTPLDITRPYLVKHTTRTVRAKVAQVLYRLDTNTLAKEHAETAKLNEITRVRISTAQSLYLDAYGHNRGTGCFILIDPLTNATVAAGMVEPDQPAENQSVAALSRIDRAARETHNGHRGWAVLLGAADIDAQRQFARALETRLFHRGVQVLVLDESLVPTDANALALTLRVLLQAGVVVLVDLPKLTRQDRHKLRHNLGDDDTLDIVVDGQGADLAGPELPALADFTVRVSAAAGAADSVDQATARAMTWLSDRGLFGAHAATVEPGADI